MDPKAGRDFFSLMLCCLLILLAYILSLPSLQQQANRGKELELSSWSASLCEQQEECCVCKLLITTSTDVKVDREREADGGKVEHTQTHMHIHTELNEVKGKKREGGKKLSLL